MRINIMDLQQLRAVWDQRGPMILPGIACLLIPCSRRHLYRLVEEEKLTAVYVHGQLHVLLLECAERWPRLNLSRPVEVGGVQALDALTVGRSGRERKT